MFDDDDMMFDDDEELGDEELDMENRFYDAKNDMEEDVETAIETFKGIVEEDENKTEWGYKSVKKLCRYYAKQGNEEETAKYFDIYLSYLSVVSVSKAEKGILLVLNDLATMSKPFYTKLMDQAIKFLEENSSFQRINFKIQIKRAQLLLDTGDFKTLEPLLDELVASCFLPNGKEDAMKSHLLIDLYALQIQLYSALDDMRKLQQLCGMINFSDRNISHPRVLGVIMKCCGKVKLLNSDYAGAKNDFFDAFKSFDEAGLDERFDALKLVVLTHMLSGSKIDIFQGQEVKAYQSHEKLVSIYELYTAFNANNVVLFVEKLHASGEEFYKDSYISGYAQILVETAQKNLLRRIVSCYKRIKLSTLAKELMLEEDTLELLVLKMIFDQTLEAKIDQFDRHLVMTEATLSVTKKYLAFSEMAKSLQVAIKP